MLVFSQYIARACLLVLSLFCVNAHAQNTACSWLATEDVDRVFPEFAPWALHGGGDVGMCTFMGDGQPSGILSVNQQFQSSAAEARSMAKDLKPGLTDSYVIEPSSALGSDGFFYRAKAGPSGNIQFLAHRDKLVLMGTVMLHREATFDRSALTALIKKMLDTSTASPKMAQAAGQCPFFEPNALRKLVSGKGSKVQAFGGDSCMATNSAGAVLTVSRTAVRDAEQMAQILTNMPDKDCVNTPLPALGKGAVMLHGCKTAAPRAGTLFPIGNFLFDLRFVPGSEPTAANRADLLDMSNFIVRTQTR